MPSLLKTIWPSEIAKLKTGRNMKPNLRRFPTLSLAVVTGFVLNVHLLTLDAQNLFVSASYCGVVYEVTPDGVQSTFASDLDQPEGLAFDRAGSLFVGESGSGTIYKFTPAGAKSTFASGLGEIRQLAFDGAGNLLVADAASGNVYAFATNGVQSTYASGLDNPYALALNTGGDLFVLCGTGESNTIVKITPGGGKTNFAAALSSPNEIAVDRAGNVFVSTIGCIYKFTPDGTQSIFVSEGLGWEWGLAFDSAGNLFAGDDSDAPSCYVYKFTPSGERSTYASVCCEPAGLAFQPPTPQLNIAPAGDQIALFWPAWATNFVLESTADLSSTNWTAVTNGTPIIGVMVTNTSPALFFRLRQF
jgi:sugar lactone lactonase YvrE